MAMSKKVRIPGFVKTLELGELRNDPMDNEGNNIATYSFNGVPDAAVNSYQWQPFTQIVRQPFQIQKMYFEVVAQSNAGVPYTITDFSASVFSTPNGFNTSYPAGLFVNNYGIVTTRGCPQNKTLMIDCGDGVAVNPGEQIVFDFTAYKAAAWALTDAINVRVAMIWR